MGRALRLLGLGIAIVNAGCGDSDGVPAGAGQGAITPPIADAGGSPAPGDGPPAPPVEPPNPTPGSAAAGTCPLTQPGATGMEKNATIPVCCVPAASDKALIDQVFRLLNQHRAANGRAALMYDDALEQAIQGHCRHMAEHSFFEHDAPEAAVAGFGTRAKLCGASASGENIAYNQSDPAAVMRTWTNSAGHNQNMLSASYRRVGICFYQRRWGQIFGR